MLTELSRREKIANIKPDPDIDMYMKVVFDFVSVLLISLKTYIKINNNINFFFLFT
jgi:hypothetical protein